MNLSLLALKNLRRHPVRTAFKVAGLGAATASMLVWGSLTRGFTNALRDTATKLELGEAQLHHPGYLKSQSPYDRIRADDAMRGALTGAGFAAAPRAYGSVLAAADELSAGAQLRGVDPVLEASVTTMHLHVQTGAWLSFDRPRGVVLGRGLAKKLKLVPQQEIVVLTQALDGALAAEIFEVQGVLRPVNKDMDDRGIYIGLSTFREVFQMPTGVHEFAVVKPGGTIDGADLRTLRTLSEAVEPVDVKGWRDRKPLLARMIALLSVTVYFTMSFTYLALGGLILNTVFMTVYDRMREYGIMKAVGMLPAQVVRLILAEMSWLAALSALLALGLGLPVALRWQETGIDLREKVGAGSFAGVNLEPYIHADVGVLQVAVPILALLVLTPLFALYPALEASRISAKEALQRL